MKLDLEEIRSITKGVTKVSEDDGYFRFFRFTDTQSDTYLKLGKNDFYKKTFGSAGVRIAVHTDTTRFAFDYRFFPASSRKFAYFDVYTDGVLYSHFGFESDEVMSGHAEISLPDGEKTLEIYFPWGRRTDIKNVEINDGASLHGVNRQHTMLSFGDSITHGYDSVHPSLSYASQISYLLDADAINKGIGGDIFCPDIVEKEDIEPDFITVAYGTNDWSGQPYESFEVKCREFYKKLSDIYPKSRIFAITPIWRKDMSKKTKFGFPADKVDEKIREFCRNLPNVTVINGWNLVPHSKEFFADFNLHPNDLGFCIYARNLYTEIMGKAFGD